MCRTPEFLLSPFGITASGFTPFGEGFSVGLFSSLYDFFQGGMMPQSYTYGYGEVVKIVAFL